MTETTTRPLNVIAWEIAQSDWYSTGSAYAARPYVEALLTVSGPNDYYGADRAGDLILYLLGNIRTWRGEDAKRIRAELKAYPRGRGDMTTAAEVRPVAVGDIFNSSWGYDQTNVDWYAVSKVSATGKTAEFIKVLGATVTDSGPYTTVTARADAAECRNCMRAIRPIKRANGSTEWRHTENGQTICWATKIYGLGDIPDRWVARDGRECSAAPIVLKRRIRWYSGRPSAIAHASYASMYRWDGEPTYQTGYGFGH